VGRVWIVWRCEGVVGEEEGLVVVGAKGTKGQVGEARGLRRGEE